MRTLTIHHSPDADDAFMFYGFEVGAISAPDYQFRHELADIETLNHRALRGEVEVTAVSVHAFAYLADRYALLRSGASMGGADYGPKVVACPGREFETVRLIGIPGKLTSAALALRLYLQERQAEKELVVIPFQEMESAILHGVVDAGVIIHEGQLTHRQQGLEELIDLGAWWYGNHQLPLPLGVNIVRRDLAPEVMAVVSRALRASIEYGFEHRREALAYAAPFGRGITLEDADRFVAMYVNELTRDLSERGVRSIHLFLQQGAEAGVIKPVQELLVV